MSNRKSWLMAFLMIGAFSFSAIASTAGIKEPKSLKNQFKDLLKNLEVDDFNDGKTLYVDFMINDKSEILVLSTTSKKMDLTIKHRLNYKILQTSELDHFKRYTLPVTVKK